MYRYNGVTTFGHTAVAVRIILVIAKQVIKEICDDIGITAFTIYGPVVRCAAYRVFITLTSTNRVYCSGTPAATAHTGAGATPGKVNAVAADATALQLFNSA